MYMQWYWGYSICKWFIVLYYSFKILWILTLKLNSIKYVERAKPWLLASLYGACKGKEYKQLSLTLTFCHHSFLCNLLDPALKCDALISRSSNAINTIITNLALNWKPQSISTKSFFLSLSLFNPFAPEPPVTARADPHPFYPLWRHQF